MPVRLPTWVLSKSLDRLVAVKKKLVFFLRGACTIGQAAQRAPQRTTGPALAGSARKRCPRTHSWGRLFADSHLKKLRKTPDPHPPTHQRPPNKPRERTHPPAGAARARGPKKMADPEWLVGSSEAEKVQGLVSFFPDICFRLFNSPHRETRKT
jgi:hypothetical protein